MLPGPDEDFDPADYDLGEIEPEPERDSYGAGIGEWAGPPRPPHEPAEEIRPDPAPAPIGKAKGTKARKPGPKVTTAIRADITAKIRFMAVPAAKVWEIRDPLCGGVAVQQEPAISAAVATIVLDSPDLMAFFTGPMGGFMKYLELGAAVLPVLQVAFAHHVAHSIGETGQPARPPVDERQYAA